MDVIEGHILILNINIQVVQDGFLTHSGALIHSGLSPWLYSPPGLNTGSCKGHCDFIEIRELTLLALRKPKDKDCNSNLAISMPWRMGENCRALLNDVSVTLLDA